MSRFVRWVNAVAEFLGRHWAAVVNVALLLYVGLPLLAPVLMHAGATAPARAIYIMYTPFCHQLPERSYFLFGQSPIYDIEELRADGVELSDNVWLRRAYIGDSEHGYKTAICQRDLAIYGTMFLAALFFSLRRVRVPRLPIILFFLMLIPIAVDGLTQLAGLRSSNWMLRTITGALFGLALIWLFYTYAQPAERGEGKK
ncbi:MAG: DUF2085 domain-containing protein [Chloroflexi bacterium]|nr:DUF2085 domain-containing protein [Chloroflexota bacterium]